MIYIYLFVCVCIYTVMTMVNHISDFKLIRYTLRTCGRAFDNDLGKTDRVIKPRSSLCCPEYFLLKRYSVCGNHALFVVIDIYTLFPGGVNGHCLSPKFMNSTLIWNNRFNFYMTMHVGFWLICLNLERLINTIWRQNYMDSCNRWSPIRHQAIIC